MRVADLLQRPMNEVLRGANLTQSQYNVLRILRGAGEEGLPCGEICERMVRRDPDLTRLLDRLEARGVVSRVRGEKDRRVVRAFITDTGLQLLSELDCPVDESLRQALSGMTSARMRELLGLLEEVRREH